jgi:hypothetical protein
MEQRSPERLKGEKHLKAEINRIKYPSRVVLSLQSEPELGNHVLPDHLRTQFVHRSPTQGG